MITDLGYSAPVDRLTDGLFGPNSVGGHAVPVNNGKIFTYALQAASDITEIASYAGWGDGGRCDRKLYCVVVHRWRQQL